MVGRFVVYEGLDGSGKSTQIRLLMNYLEKKGRSYNCVREPGDTPTGQAIRKLLKAPQRSFEALDAAFEGHEDYPPSGPFSGRTPLAELLMFMTARAELYEWKIKNDLSEGKFLIGDRGALSSVAYQGYGRWGGDEAILSTIEKLHELIGCKYDLVILLDLDIEKMVGRFKERQGRDLFENEREQFFRRVREGYLTEAKKRPDLFLVIDAELPIEEIFDRIKPRMDILL